MMTFTELLAVSLEVAVVARLVDLLPFAPVVVAADVVVVVVVVK
jgi:hypothetical protein